MATLEELKKAMKWCLDHPGEHLKCGKDQTLWWSPEDLLFCIRIQETHMTIRQVVLASYRERCADYLKNFDFEKVETQPIEMSQEQWAVIQAAEAWKDKVRVMGLGFAEKELGYLYDRVKRMQEARV